MPTRSGTSQRVAIVGASSLLGKELKRVLEDRNFPATEIVLLDESHAAGTLTEAGGEATFIQPLDADSLEGARFAFFAGNPETAAKNWEAGLRLGASVIDLTGGVPPESGTFAWIPGLDAILPAPSAVVARPGSKAGSKSSARNEKRPLYLSPGSGLIIAAALSAALREFNPARVVLTFFPPVSEAGQEGVDELETQTTNLLTFHGIERRVFDAQVAFNLLTAYGPESRRSLRGIRKKLAADLAAYLEGRTTIPAIEFVQAPIFYGYAFSAYAEFPSPPDAARMEAAFAVAGMKVAKKSEGPPDNVIAAGESEIQIGQLDCDPSIANGCWIWGVADNLRLAATNAVRIAEELLVIPA
jgi:aspartate-semialdehyde dehydrogenase